MERPQKRPRLGLAPHDESDDDDELSYEPEEICQRREPGARLARSRATAAFGLKSAFESIFERYERDFEGVADEIDLRTADIVVDNCHLQGMRNERDMGNAANETGEEEVPVHRGAARGDGEGAGTRGASADDEDEDHILQGKSNAIIRKAPGALAPRALSSLAQRPGISSQLGGAPQLPPLGASPLFFGSWGPPGAMDPAWQAPQLQVPQFKSSFAADLFTGRYQLPAREASRSIWAPGSHSDDDDEDNPPDKARMRLVPPTRRVPARPKAMKLIRAPPTNADDSGDEDFILMGVNASQVPNGSPKPLPGQQGSAVDDDEADLLLDRLERELEDRNETGDRDGTVSFASARPVVTRPEGPSAVANSARRADRRRDLRDVKHSPSAKGSRGSPVNKRKGRRVSSPRKTPVLGDKSARTVARSAPSNVPADHNVQQPVRNQQESVVIELPPSCLLDDGSYLDFSNIVDLLTDEPHSSPIHGDHPSPYFKGQHDRTAEDHENSQIPSDRTIPDSQDPPVSLPSSSAPDAPTKQLPEKPRQDKKKQKKDSSAYDLSDDEVGFLARPPRKRKRISDFASSTALGERTPTDPIADTDGEARASTNRCVKDGVSSASKPATAQNSSEDLFSPIRTRSARVKAKSTGAFLPKYPQPEKAVASTRPVPGERRLTPTSLNSADDTEGKAISTQERVNTPLPIALVSPPPETETAGMAAEAKEGSNVQAEPLEPAADAVAINAHSRPEITRSSRTKTTRGRPEGATGYTATSSELTPPSHDRLEPKAPPPLGHRQLRESQNTVNLTLTPGRERPAKLAAAGPSNLLFKPATPSKLKLSLPNTPTSVPSTGHRSITSLVPEEGPDNDSEDELTSSSLFSLFQKPTPAPPSGGKGARRRAPEGTPTKPRRRVSAVRLSATFSAERPSALEESVMRTPGGTIRKCGERGLKCGKDFCFTCC